jgi:hypothetical protein
VLSRTVDVVVELLLRVVTAVARAVVPGRDVLADVAAGWSWSAAMWAAVALAAVALAVGVWTAFWDD